jgi:hypothetical protein
MSCDGITVTKLVAPVARVLKGGGVSRAQVNIERPGIGIIIGRWRNEKEYSCRKEKELEFPSGKAD